MLPVLVLVAAVLLAALGAGVAQLRCADAAREAARAAARDEPDAVVAAVGRRLAPPGAVVAVSADGDDVVVVVRLPVRLLGVGPALDVQGRARAAREPR